MKLNVIGIATLKVIANAFVESTLPLSFFKHILFQISIHIYINTIHIIGFERKHYSTYKVPLLKKISFFLPSSIDFNSVGVNS